MTTVDKLKYLLQHNQFIHDDLAELFAVICKMEDEFKPIRLTNKAKECAGHAWTAAAKQAKIDLLPQGSGANSSSEEEGDRGVINSEPQTSTSYVASGNPSSSQA